MFQKTFVLNKQIWTSNAPQEFYEEGFYQTMTEATVNEKIARKTNETEVKEVKKSLSEFLGHNDRKEVIKPEVEKP